MSPHIWHQHSMPATYSFQPVCLWNVGGNESTQETHAVTGMSEEWRADTPRDVTAQRDLCARIPCHYSYPLHVDNKPWDGVWMKDEKYNVKSIAFHSEDHRSQAGRFHHRTWLSGNLKDGDCLLVINDIMFGDEGPYHFRIEFPNQYHYSFYPVTQLHVSGQRSQATLVILLAAAAGAVFLIISLVVICFVLRTQCRTSRPPADALGPVSEKKSRVIPIRKKQKKLSQENVKNDSKVTPNHDYQVYCIYENCRVDENAIYANI
ncbi:sialic acid-binding Ig-like lectin 15 isoform X2 [Mobula birostris]|uniref:sialic acid-binding Ig-like lectin 15 isoform X2 n=1 Tax=Mobula birostris TaxID=1983395 RepID=UPI003B283E09